MEYSLEVVTVEGSRHFTPWGVMSDEELTQTHNFLKQITEMKYFHMETDAGTAYFNPAHVVSVTLRKREAE
jgi:hypothetical protein